MYRPARSSLLLLSLSVSAVVTSLAACGFLDDDEMPRIRGYTSCGDFMSDDVWCQPGQFCADSTFSDCDIGCLSDVNCASNQVCVITDPREPGYCENIRAVASALEGSASLALDGSGY